MADITDFFGKASIDTDHAIATTVIATRAPGATVLEADDLSKFADDTPVFVVTYKKTTDPVTDVVSITELVSWKALVNTGANTLTNLTLAPGYVDGGNDEGDFIECIPTSYWNTELINGLLTSLNPDGTIKAPVVGSVHIQKFTADGTYTPTAGMLYCQIEAVGGGGAGGGSDGASSNTVVGAGGGSGGYSRSIKTAADIGASKAVDIGAGGTGVSAAAGNAGADTTVGTTLVVAKGGAGGGVGLTQIGGAGGVAGTGDVTITGNQGEPGNIQGAFTNYAAKGGAGGVSFFGGGATSPFTITTQTGVAGKTGSGGSGGASYNTGSDTAGGAGGDGYVLITEYIRI